MNVRYAGKSDINGNAYQLIVDFANKKFIRGYFLYVGLADEKFKTRKRDIDKYANFLIKIGFTEVKELDDDLEI